MTYKKILPPPLHINQMTYLSFRNQGGLWPRSVKKAQRAIIWSYIWSWYSLSQADHHDQIWTCRSSLIIHQQSDYNWMIFCFQYSYLWYSACIKVRKQEKVEVIAISLSSIVILKVHLLKEKNLCETILKFRWFMWKSF